MANIGDMVFDGVRYGIVSEVYNDGWNYDIVWTHPETSVTVEECFFTRNYVATWRRNFVEGYHQ